MLHAWQLLKVYAEDLEAEPDSALVYSLQQLINKMCLVALHLKW